MVPDLVGMAGVRLSGPLGPGVDAGRRLHHVADGAFHDHPAFRAGLARLRQALPGLAVGARRGAAHVGFELLLDTTLPWEDGDGAALTAARAGGGHVADHLDGPSAARWSRLIDRLVEVDLLAPADDAAWLAARVEAVLGRRPRLALRPGDVDAVATALEQARRDVEEAAPSLLADMVDAVRRAALAGVAGSGPQTRRE
jgi:hypothetical protein